MGKLNKLTSILLSAIMIIGIFGVVPFAASAAVSGSYEYSVKSDSTAKITRSEFCQPEVILSKA